MPIIPVSYSLYFEPSIRFHVTDQGSRCIMSPGSPMIATISTLAIFRWIAKTARLFFSTLTTPLGAGHLCQAIPRGNGGRSSLVLLPS